MPSALSIDLRQRVVHAVEASASRHQAAERFGVSLASASRWCEQFARESHVNPPPSMWFIAKFGGSRSLTLRSWRGRFSLADRSMNQLVPLPGCRLVRGARDGRAARRSSLRRSPTTPAPRRAV